jgi:hypothetical protein
VESSEEDSGLDTFEHDTTKIPNKNVEIVASMAMESFCFFDIEMSIFFCF